MSLVNTSIKPFSNTAFQDGKFINISEKDIKGKWNIFFFYPADFTFVCPTELGDLADHYEEFQKIGVEIYAISTDTHFSHKEWHNNSATIRKIKYAMIGDSNWQLTRNFDVMRKYYENGEEKELGLAERGTFIIDPKGIIQAIEITPEVIGRNALNLLHKIQAIQYIYKHPGEVCPAKWKIGEPTLSPSLDLVGKI
ncbi:MAG: alkyl hydroperoxide reductase subunit C [Arsenophonus sp.]|nr:MAG: alkyl hydroperoxide reductase subunit C [Arsenophonus sp.]